MVPNFGLGARPGASRDRGDRVDDRPRDRRRRLDNRLPRGFRHLSVGLRSVRRLLLRLVL